jgi:hypothetical protein
LCLEDRMASPRQENQRVLEQGGRNKPSSLLKNMED